MMVDTLPKWIKVARKHPIWMAQYLLERACRVRMDDEAYLRLIYEFTFGRELDLENPKTFNEKLQWLKLHDRKPVYTTMVDKYAVKKYVADAIGEKYVIPMYGVWDRFDEIDFDLLPDQFVLKCTHDSGSLIIVRDKGRLDRGAAKAKLTKCLRRNYYYGGREWPYKNVKPRIIAEKYMEEKDHVVPDMGIAAGMHEEHMPLADYKVLCFEGQPKLVEVHRGRGTGQHSQDFYDTEWHRTAIQQRGEKNALERIKKPSQLHQILDLSGKLSGEMHHVRVDWYVVRDAVYFGEMTFFDSSGFGRFTDDGSDLLLGSWIRLDMSEPAGGMH